jgi:uncharacterized protein (DUF2384 family)
MKIDARAAHHQRELAVMTDSLAWRLTAPLRALSAFRRRRTDATRSFSSDGGHRVRRVPTVLGRRLTGSYLGRRRSR